MATAVSLAAMAAEEELWSLVSPAMTMARSPAPTRISTALFTHAPLLSPDIFRKVRNSISRMVVSLIPKYWNG